MDNVKIYEISRNYISYLAAFAPHLFCNSKSGQANERKYIGVILQVNGMDYFAPLSSFKPKHKKMDEMLDFIKVRNYAVINLNNMFPVPISEYRYVDFSAIIDAKYKSLLQAEYSLYKRPFGRTPPNCIITSWSIRTIPHCLNAAMILCCSKASVQNTKRKRIHSLLIEYKRVCPALRDRLFFVCLKILKNHIPNKSILSCSTSINLPT